MKYQRTKNRVLLVSNDFTVRESLGDILQSDGFEVLSAENGVKAIKALAANPINVIVLDYRTPFDRKDFVSGRSSTLEALTRHRSFPAAGAYARVGGRTGPRNVADGRHGVNPPGRTFGAVGGH